MSLKVLCLTASQTEELADSEVREEFLCETLACFVELVNESLPMRKAVLVSNLLQMGDEFGCSANDFDNK